MSKRSSHVTFTLRCCSGSLFFAVGVRIHAHCLIWCIIVSSYLGPMTNTYIRWHTLQTIKKNKNFNAFMSSYVYFWRTSDASRVSKFNAKFQERRIRRTFYVESALFAASVSLTAILAKSSILLTLLGEVKKWRLPQDSNILDWLSDDWLTTDSLTRLDERRLTRLKLVILVGESMNESSITTKSM